MDILTGMMVMSMIIGMVFYLLTAANQQHHNYTKVRFELNEFMLMHADIKRQVDLAQNIYDLPNGFVLKNKENELRYYRSGKVLLRESVVSVDTLHRNVTGISFEYEGQNNSGNKLITQISVHTKLQQQEINAYFFKEYSKAESINHQLINEL